VAVTRSAAALLLASLCLLAPASQAQFDPIHTSFEFHLRTRWGQRVDGRFPLYDGGVEHLPDGRRRVRIALATDALEIGGSRRYTELARGPRFFDAARYPQLTFVSEPFSPALLEHGGALAGTLTLHGVSRTEVFEVEPASCARPGVDCTVVARGSVQRDDYGLDGLRVLLGNRVHFRLHVRHGEGS
jgi:polyisoprenoid-binding protein YceI